MRNLVYVRIKEILKEEKKTKYWFVKQGGYQAISHLMDNKTTAIHFHTLEKVCRILNREPGDVIVLKRKGKVKNE